MNGSLIGTLGTYLVAKSTDNHELFCMAEAQGELYKKYSDEYFYANDDWCYYMRGGGKTINQDHYVIFEIRILNALYAITGDSFYHTEAIRRIDMMKKYYQLYIDSDNSYLFIRGGAPHYYYIDIYGTRLSFYDEDNNLIDEVEKTGRNFEDSLIEGVLPIGTTSVRWSVVTTYYTVDMGELLFADANNDTEIINLKSRADYI